jgi:hypothetical protein
MTRPHVPALIVLSYVGVFILGAATMLIGNQLRSDVLVTHPAVITDRTLWVDDKGAGFSILGESGLPKAKSYSALAAAGRECLTPLLGGQRVEFGVVTASPTAQAPGAELVVWIRCLD